MAKHISGAMIAGAAGGAAALAAVGAAGAVAVGTALARMVVTPSEKTAEGVVVERIEQRDDSVTAAATGPSDTKPVATVWLRGADVSLPGEYSLLFDQGAGHARLGEICGHSGGSVARPVLAVDRGQLRAGVQGRITGWWYTTPEELGYRTERVTYATELGPAEAWIVHPRIARKKRWAVHVHGRGARPEEALRGVAPLARAGITSLIISYRNDAGAPAGANGRYGIGVSESRDVDAAIAFAVGRGAERITLLGWSMGGTACLLSATRGAHLKMIDGLILDSPAIDWSELLRHQAGDKGMPGLLADVGLTLLRRGWVRGGEPSGLPLTELVPEAFARDLSVPVLIHASAQDSFVPCGPAEKLAALRPDTVHLRLQKTGEHVKLWNTEPEAWERGTEAFARSLSRPAWRG